MGIYFDILKFGFSRSTAYPTEVFAVILRKIFDLGVTLLFWFVLSKTASISLTTQELLSYFLIAEAIKEITFLTSLKFGKNTLRKVKRGDINTYL